MTCVAALPGVGAIARQSIPNTIAERTVACAACHGKEGRATGEGIFPRIAGKPADYLYSQLINFRDGRRHYLPMTYMVDHLSDAYLREMATYFSTLRVPYPPPQAVTASRAQLQRGQRLVMKGDMTINVPACIACHGEKLTGVAPSTPGLVGLPRDYLNAQFGSWRNKARRTVAPDCMAKIIARLSPDDIAAATAWLASQTVPTDSAPATSLPGKRPMSCGSISQGRAGQP